MICTNSSSILCPNFLTDTSPIQIKVQTVVCMLSCFSVAIATYQLALSVRTYVRTSVSQSSKPKNIIKSFIKSHQDQQLTWELRLIINLRLTSTWDQHWLKLTINWDWQSNEINNQPRSAINQDQQSTEINNQLRSTINLDWQLTEIDWLNLIATGKPFRLVFKSFLILTLFPNIHP